MNTDVVIKRTADPPVLLVWDSLKAVDRGDAPLEFTRLWMGLCGPHGTEPGYACIVGEEYDGDPRQKARRKVLLDEAQALRPEDFTPAQRETYAALLYAERHEADGSTRRIIKADNPTLDDLRQAAIALKDLYWYGGEGDRLQVYVPPTDTRFGQYMLATEGLCRDYPRTQQGHPMDPEQLRAWYPFYQDSDRIAPLSNDVPFGEDEEYGRQLVESLLARDDLLINDHCRLFDDQRLEHPLRAVALVCAAMQAMDWSFRVREWRESDGYEDISESDERVEEEERRFEEDMALRLYMAGMPMPPPSPQKKEQIEWHRMRR